MKSVTIPEVQLIHVIRVLLAYKVDEQKPQDIFQLADKLRRGDRIEDSQDLRDKVEHILQESGLQSFVDPEEVAKGVFL